MYEAIYGDQMPVRINIYAVQNRTSTPQGCHLWRPKMAQRSYLMPSPATRAGHFPPLILFR